MAYRKDRIYTASHPLESGPWAAKEHNRPYFWLSGASDHHLYYSRKGYEQFAAIEFLPDGTFNIHEANPRSSKKDN